MFKEILQITPKLDSGDLNKMEKTLTSRFTKIAKAFGKGLALAVGAKAGSTGGIGGVLGGLVGGPAGAIAGVAADAVLGIFDKLLNPLKEAQDAVDRFIKSADDAVTNAEQFGTTSGKLFKLQELAAAKGLDAQSLDVLLVKFQTAIAQAAANPNQPSAVSQFVGVANKTTTDANGNTVTKQDTAEAFFQFIQALKKMSTNDQLLVQQQVFGEKQILRMSEFLNADFGQLTKQIGGPSTDVLTKSLNKGSNLSDFQDILKATRELNDVVDKGKLVNKDIILAQDAKAKLDLQRQNTQIANLAEVQKISVVTNQIANAIDSMELKLGSLILKISDLAESVKNIANSRTIKGFIKLIGGGN